MRPNILEAIVADTERLGFSMASEPKTGSLLRLLAASKPRARVLEIGTGTGISAAWLLEGMDDASTLVSVDNDAQCQEVARKHLVAGGTEHPFAQVRLAARTLALVAIEHGGPPPWQACTTRACDFPRSAHAMRAEVASGGSSRARLYDSMKRSRCAGRVERESVWHGG